VQAVLDDQVTQRRHPPVLAGILAEAAAPFADEQRRRAVLVDVQPVGPPHVVGQRRLVEGGLEPRLVEDERTVVVR
jgi:hypothetical protein